MPSNKSCNTCKYFSNEAVEKDSCGRCIYNDEGFNLWKLRACSCYTKSLLCLINNTIRDEICNTKGSNCWLSRKYIIKEKLEKLNPDMPKNGSIGKIAFDVPDKPRMKLRTQRFLTRKLNLNDGYLPDHLISSIANKINSVLFPDVKIELVNGEKITECYKKAVGGGSCMTDSCADFTKLYEMNPDKIQMLTMHYMNDSARAILYKLDNDKGYYLDRVYASCRLLEDKMYAYADNNSWSSYRDKSSKNSIEKDNLIISDLHYEEGHVPYMDTFGGTLCNSKLTLSYNSYDICMDSTNGYLESDRYTCEWCNEHVHEDNTVSIGDYIYCEYCVNENFTFCEYCGEYVTGDDIIFIEDTEIYVCVHHANRNYTQCSDCGNYNENNYIVVEEEHHVCLECIENNDKYIQCRECSEWFYRENTEDGYCESCEAQKTSVSDCKPEPIKES